MAAVDITISGVLWDKASKSGRAVVLIGEATLTGLGVGGGPIYPPEGGGGVPPGGGGGPGYHPEHPIYYPPHPAHPIVLPPDPPTEPPVEPPTNPPNLDWKWAWSPSQGWHPAYVPEGGKPQPVPPPSA